MVGVWNSKVRGVSDSKVDDYDLTSGCVGMVGRCEERRQCGVVAGEEGCVYLGPGYVN